MNYITLLIFCMVPVLAGAQSSNESLEVMKTINTLFRGMNLGDSSMVRSIFTDDATLTSISHDKTGKPIIRRESSVAGFLKAVGSPHQEPWSEPIWDARIEIDGDFAQVWAPYAFYVGKTFSHCGVDSFQLIKMEGIWKIFHLIDTRRKSGCTIPKSISDHYK